MVPLFAYLASVAGGAEPISSGFRKASSSSLQWRTASSRTTQPGKPPATGEGPELLTADVEAKPLSDEPAPRALKRDDAVVQVQAKAGADPLADPFGDKQAKPAPRLLEPKSPLEAGGTTLPPLPALPNTADQLAVIGGGFAQEPCPKMSDLKPIGAITNKIAASQGELPRECFFDESVSAPQNRAWQLTNYTWKASGMCHKPLYFEEPALERYGHSTGPFSQPIVSGAHFFATLPLLPYKMGLNPPWECKYALGYYRPGSCAPYIIPGVPISARGLASQAAVTAGVIYLFP